jgi:hypothetical protein
MLLAFKAKEAERKMREAAAKHDYEAAIPLRDEWKALTAEISEMERKAAVMVVERKVIDIKTKAPVTPEPDRSGYTVIDLVEPKDGEHQTDEFVPNEGDVWLINDLTRSIHAGEFSGLCVLAGMRGDNGEIVGVECWTTEAVEEDLQRYLGALAQLKHDLLCLADEAYYDEDEDSAT